MDTAWIQHTRDYLDALFGSSSSYDQVADVRAEIVSLSREIRLLREQKQRQMAAYRRQVMAPNQLGGGQISSDSNVVQVSKSNQGDPVPVYNAKALEERKERIDALDTEIGEKRHRIKLLKLSTNKHLYWAGIFLFLIMMYKFLGGAAVYRKMYVQD